MKTKYFLLLSLLAIPFISCEVDLEPYNEADDRIIFVFTRGMDSVTNYSFALYPSDMLETELSIEVKAMGYLSDVDRKVTVRQIDPPTGLKAEPGVHFVPFDDERVAGSYVIEANATRAKLPLIVKRDPSLRTDEYVIEIELVDNEYFIQGIPSAVRKRIVISDMLTQPSTWVYAHTVYYGPYGPVKYQLMIDAAAKYDAVLDEEWFRALIYDLDYSYVTFWGSVFANHLKKVNEERSLMGLGPITEDGDSTPISFGNY